MVTVTSNSYITCCNRLALNKTRSVEIQKKIDQRNLVTTLFRSVCRLIVQLLVCQMFCFPVGERSALRKSEPTQ